MILVTGVSGFVGSAVFNALTSQGRAVVGTTNQNTSMVKGEVVQIDLSNKQKVDALYKKYNIKSCIHCASVMTQKSMQLPVAQTIDSNVTSTINLSHRTKTLVVSSGSVFQGEHNTINEDTVPQSQSVYSLTKRLSELAAIDQSQTVARISWIYGPPIKSPLDIARGPIPYMMHELSHKHRFESTAGGDYTASFTYIEDVVSGLLALHDHSNLKHKIYHLGTGQNTTLKQVAALLENITGMPCHMGSGVGPWGPGTKQREPLGHERILGELGWRPKHDLESGLRKYWEWYVA